MIRTLHGMTDLGAGVRRQRTARYDAKLAEVPLIIAIMLVSGVLSAFMNNIAAVAVLLPAVAGSAERAIRYGSFLMIFIYIIGLFVLLFAPETKGKPLPED